jgi:hypothetical protein
MKPLIRNILAVIAGFLGGSLINMGLIRLGHLLFPVPGIFSQDINALAEVMPDLEAKHFLFPFLAHALGTLCGSLLVGLIAAGHKMAFALSVGVLFLAGGLLACFMIPAPSWFIAVDLLLAYLPMAWLGGKTAIKYTNHR